MTTEARTPRTAEEWAKWMFDQEPDPKFVIEGIRRAQEQARREAIEECAKLLQDDALLTRDLNTVSFTVDGKHILRPGAEEPIGYLLSCATKILTLLREKNDVPKL